VLRRTVPRDSGSGSEGGVTFFLGFCSVFFGAGFMDGALGPTSPGSFGFTALMDVILFSFYSSFVLEENYK
jgi:hypothetical protein